MNDNLERRNNISFYPTILSSEYQYLLAKVKVKEARLLTTDIDAVFGIVKCKPMPSLSYSVDLPTST